MAPTIPNQKRKRGHPSDASAVEPSATRRSPRTRRAVEAPEPQLQHNEQDFGEGERPTKRSRQQGSGESGSRDATSVSRLSQPRERAGGARASNVGTKASRRKPGMPQIDGDKTADPQPRRSKRDRNSGDGTPWWEASAIADKSHQPQEGREAAPPQKKKRGRPSLSDTSASKTPNRATPATASGAQAAAKKQGRPSLPREGPQEGAKPPRRRGRPSNSSQTAGRDQEGSRASRKRPAGARDEVEARGTEEADVGAAAHNLRRSKYRHLVARTRHIPRSTISAKWIPLDNGAIAAVASLLTDAERPVLLRLRDSDRRREHARAAVAGVSRRIRSKLTKGMPFPPASSMPRPTAAGPRSGHQDDLDFERIVDSIQSLEKQLDPILHSVELLTREKEREEHVLEREYESLRALETNARGEARTWRERIRRSHILAPEMSKASQAATTSRDEMGLLARQDEVLGGIFQGSQDEELTSLSKQLGSHMESLKGNLEQIEGIAPAMTRSKAALQHVLHKHLDSRQYEQLILG